MNLLIQRSLLIHGYGNPLREDDGIGPAVVEALRPHLTGIREIILQISHQLTPELVDCMAEVDTVLLIDAAAEGEIGAIRFEQARPCAPQPGATHHHCAPETLLALCERLYGRVPRLYIASIVGADFGFREGLSPVAREAIPILARRILTWIESGMTV